MIGEVETARRAAERAEARLVRLTARDQWDPARTGPGSGGPRRMGSRDRLRRAREDFRAAWSAYVDARDAVAEPGA